MKALATVVVILLFLTTTASGSRVRTRTAALGNTNGSNLPLVINTWPFTVATQRAWQILTESRGDVLTAVEKGVSACEDAQCDGTVGYGGSPDERGHVTLDAMIVNGDTLEMGSALGLHDVREAISAARLVMEHTNHTILAGLSADDFAAEMGLPRQSLITNHSSQLWKDWKDNQCQPNYRRNVTPDPRTSCGPYKPLQVTTSRTPRTRLARQKQIQQSPKGHFGKNNHDTIGMIAINEKQQIAAGTSTNGATHKVPGRLADSGIPGSGAYADSEVGACAATGDGDVMMRFVPSYQCVESMRQGMSPKDAAEDAIARIRNKYPHFQGALIAVDTLGNHAGATNCMDFHYSIVTKLHQSIEVVPVPAAVPCPA